MNTVDPLETWKTDFGNEYSDRNEHAEWKTRDGVEAFRRIVEGLGVQSVVEVGSNVGLNLVALRELLGPDASLYAVEPNRKAFERITAHPRLGLAGAWNCDAFSIPLPDRSVDLAFTCGVLIHVAPDRLEQAVSEIRRVSRRYVVCMEYFSHVPTEVKYRGHDGMLFKRDFGSYYLERFPDLRCIKYGFLWQRDLPRFDNLNWWLFERQQV